MAPLQVDEDKDGKDSDHNIVILPPIKMSDNRKRIKKPIITRPLPESGIEQFSQFISGHSWEEVLAEQDMKVEKFHQTLRLKLDECFPEKTVMVSYLDKKWMTPQLKNLNRKVKREFYKRRKSPKWKKLKKQLKKL